MLRRLSVSNLAIVEKVEIVLANGLNVITGETGAGKSVLMGALDLVLGGRAESGVVRDGASEAEVEAEFDEGVIRRTLTREGRSRAWINDESVSVSELKAFTAGLVDIHGPRANQRLLDANFQRETLDGFGRVDLEDYAAAYKTFSALKAERAAIGDPMSEEEIDFLRFQVNELESAELSEEDETIEERHAAAAHQEEIISNANDITEGIGGDRGVTAILASLQPRFAAAARHLPAAREWAGEAEEITIRLQELSREIASSVSRLADAEEDLNDLDARLTVINKLKRKYRRTDVAGLMSLLAEKKEKLDGADLRDIKLAELEKKISAAEDKVRLVGAKLTKAREKAGQKLAKAITSELRDLGFVQAKFDVRLDADEISPSGLDRVVYLFEPNPGESARPLASIASSGEIARVMLAAKVVLADADTADGACGTMVFDEIDANIGGEVGKVVGEKMRAVSKRHQVIAITHLPQSAVYGEKHFVVAKSVSGGRTRTGVNVVDGEKRIAEIARMLGGEKLTSVVKRHAEELLELSR